MTKPWAGRFKENTAPITERFTSSTDQDERLAPFDVLGSLAHVNMLSKQDIISESEANVIVDGLKKIYAEIENGTFNMSDQYEDVHMNVEARLKELAGDVAGKLHTARSRNDQVSTDLRMYTRAEIVNLSNGLLALIDAMITLGEKYPDTVLPGYTHLQQAQPVYFKFYLQSHIEALLRDLHRLEDVMKRVNVSPLGACAMAGTSFPADPEYTAELLGFDGTFNNAMDAVSDRDFIVETVSACALIAAHLSSLSEDIIIYNSREFGYITLGDSFTTGSSIMPHKKNPDIPELVRGKTGKVYGALISILTALKGLPRTYNRDLQEDKLPLYNAVDTVADSLEVLAAMVPTITVNTSNIEKALDGTLMPIQDLADDLARKGTPFRDAHAVAGKIVAYCIDSGKKLSDLTLEELSQFHQFDESVLKLLSVESCVEMKRSPGGTSKGSVSTSWESMKGHCSQSKADVGKMRTKSEKMAALLDR